MSNEPPRTVGRLRQDGIITNDEIAAAIEAYIQDPQAQPFEFESGHVLDVAAAVAGHKQAKAALAERSIPDVYRRTMVRVALILATPEAK